MFDRRVVPSWSPFPDVRTHRAFTNLAHQALRAAGVSVAERRGGRLIATSAGPALDLADLAAAVVDAPRSRWPALVRGRVGALLDPNVVPDDPSVLRASVRCRLVPRDALSQLSPDVVHRPHADLAEVLVVDGPRSVIWVELDQLAPLEMDVQALFALARDNLRFREPITVDRVRLSTGSVLLAQAESGYVASWSLLLDELIEVPADGVVLAVPHRRLLLARPLDGPDAHAAVQAMIAPTVQQFSAAPDNISPHLYLFLDGHLATQRVTRDARGQLGLEPSPVLTEILQRLAR